MTRESRAFRLLVVDDEEDLADDIKDQLFEDLEDGLELSIAVEEDFENAEQRLQREDFDMVVLDVREGGSDELGAVDEARGADLYARIRKIRWVPVVFFTAVPAQVRHLEDAPLVQVVSKSRREDLTEAVRVGLNSDVISITRRLSNLVNDVSRNFLRKVVAPNWGKMAEADQREIAPAVVNRLAAELKEYAVHQLHTILDTDTDTDTGSTVQHPSAARVYLMPPVTKHYTSADLLQDPDENWWLVLTPACDLYEDPPGATTPKPRQAKAEYVRLASACPLKESTLCREWESKGGGKEREALKSAFRSDHNRYRVLPRFLDVIPDLLVDFENVRSVPLDDVRGWTRVATLDSPFAEAVLTANSRSIGRIGNPDINFDGLFGELGLGKKKNISSTKPVPHARNSSEIPVKD